MRAVRRLQRRSPLGCAVAAGLFLVASAVRCENPRRPLAMKSRVLGLAPLLAALCGPFGSLLVAK